MTRTVHTELSRRESQIMDIVYRLGETGVAEVVQHIPDEPAYNTVRVTMGILERKGYLKHRQIGQRYLYTPSLPVDKVKRSAVSHLVHTFFEGSSGKAVLALLGMNDEELTRSDLDEISEWIERARKTAR